LPETLLLRLKQQIMAASYFPPNLKERLFYSLPVEGENLKSSLEQARTGRTDYHEILHQFNLPDCAYAGMGQSAIVLKHEQLPGQVIKVYTWPILHKIEAYNTAVAELKGSFHRYTLLPIDVHASSTEGICIITAQQEIEGVPALEEDLTDDHILRTEKATYALDKAPSNFIRNPSGLYYIDLLEVSAHGQGIRLDQ
jgi:hypothetical protein